MALERAFTLKYNYHHYLGTAKCSPPDDLVLFISVECPLNYVISVIIGLNYLTALGCSSYFFSMMTVCFLLASH